MADLAGRVALVTGGARGLGAAAAKALAAEGAKVVVSDVRDGEETAASVGGAYVKHDVTSEEDWAGAVTFAKQRFGGLDILVNNAGIYWMKPIAMESLESFRKMQQVNVDGVFLGLKHAIPAIAERGAQWDGGGAIVNRRPHDVGLQRLQGRGAAYDQDCRHRVRARRHEGACELGAPRHHRNADDGRGDDRNVEGDGRGRQCVEAALRLVPPARPHGPGY
jgi:threonine dehydrogenase-like Zn-dependent dehydrogenase